MVAFICFYDLPDSSLINTFVAYVKKCHEVLPVKTLKTIRLELSDNFRVECPLNQFRRNFNDVFQVNLTSTV